MTIFTTVKKSKISYAEFSTSITDENINKMMALVIVFTSKIFGRIVKKDKRNKLSAFRSERSCLNNLFCVIQIIEK